MLTALVAKTVLTPVKSVQEGVVLVEDGVIRDAGSRDQVEVPSNARVIDFGDRVLAPGLIDLHVHGGAGYDLMEATDDERAAIERLMGKHGITSYCPTTVTASVEDTMRAVASLGKAASEGPARSGQPRAVPLGIHLEGPFLSHAKRGVHPAHLLLEPSVELFAHLWEASQAHVRVMTIAPELPNAIEVIAEASRRGVCVSLGHSNAHYAEARDGVAAGARHATHTFNAMRALDHRDPGILAAVLTDHRLTADIIADGIHVDPAVVDLFVRAKGVDAAVLITDGLSATGMPDGTYTLGDLQVTVHEGRCEANGTLAGSVLTLDRAVRNVVQFAKVSFQDSLRMATINPARALGLDSRKGVLKKGADADVVVFTEQGEVVQAIVAGIVN